MTTATIPTSPAVEIAATRQRVLLPTEAAALLGRGHCSLDEAARFLGVCKNTAHARAQRYRRRVQSVMFDGQGRPRPYDAQELVPRMVLGEWVEVANTKSGVIRCDTRYLVAMVYPAVGMP